MRLLGPVTLTRDGSPVPFTAPTQRTLISNLVLAHDPASRDQIVDASSNLTDLRHTAAWRRPHGYGGTQPHSRRVRSRTTGSRGGGTVLTARRSPHGDGQMLDFTTSAMGQAPPMVVEMTVAVVPRSGWWLDQNETPASPPDIVISGESDLQPEAQPVAVGLARDRARCAACTCQRASPRSRSAQTSGLSRTAPCRHWSCTSRRLLWRPPAGGRRWSATGPRPRRSPSAARPGRASERRNSVSFMSAGEQTSSRTRSWYDRPETRSEIRASTTKPPLQ